MTISGKRFRLWCAVDQHGVVLDEILQSQRDKRAAKRLLRRLMKRTGSVAMRIITDKLCSFGAAKRELLSEREHWSR
ncbi:DDE-type integrase/transposase/recombinase [Cereibacter sphaeroides]|nr:DDE-type integrase/transposase/recombinase [Cereibacter sphaeroides]